MGAGNGQVVSIPNMGIFDAETSENEENNHSNQCIDDGEEWIDKRAPNVASDISPVEGDRNETEAGQVAKELVDGYVVGSNPANPVEDGNASRNPAGEPVPGKRASHDEQKVTVAADNPSVCIRRIGGLVVVEGVHHGRICQIRWPDHSRGPNQKASDDTSHTEAQALGRQGKKDLEAPAKVLTIEDLLSEKDICSISSATLNRYTRHHNDHGMLLDVERTGVEAPSEAKSIKLVARQSLKY